MPAPVAAEKAEELQKHVDKPTPQGEKVLKEHEVKAEPNPIKKQENQNNMATAQTTTETSEYRYKPEQIDWDTMKNLGLSKEYLEKKGTCSSIFFISASHRLSRNFVRFIFTGFQFHKRVVKIT